jgi:hypothetical protein
MDWFTKTENNDLLVIHYCYKQQFSFNLMLSNFKLLL